MKLLEDAGIYVLVVRLTEEALAPVGHDEKLMSVSPVPVHSAALHQQDDTARIVQSRAAGALLLHCRLHGSLSKYPGFTDSK